jgi:hypothetical protein
VDLLWKNYFVAPLVPCDLCVICCCESDIQDTLYIDSNWGPLQYVCYTIGDVCTKVVYQKDILSLFTRVLLLNHHASSSSSSMNGSIYTVDLEKASINQYQHSWHIFIGLVVMISACQE